MQDLFTLRAAALPPGTRVAGFRGSEGISRLYAFDVYLVLVDALGHEVDMAAAIGGRATLFVEQPDGGGPRPHTHGIVSKLVLVHEAGERSVFRATLVPEMWLLGETVQSRVFTDQSIPDILGAVLRENGVTDVSFQLSGSYASEEHVCQYHESDLDFVSRWMERASMYYYFVQGDDREKLVITDERATHLPLSPRPVRYYPQRRRDFTVGQAFGSFTCEHSASPARVRVRDYDYEKPGLDVSATAPVSGTPGTRGRVSFYGERVFSPDASGRLARIRAEAIAARQVVFHAAGPVTTVRAGFTFEIEDHPRAAFNAKYLATSVEHRLNQAAGTPEIEDVLGAVADEVYAASVAAIPAAVQYRAEETTPWPRIYGFEAATVDGPATSDYAQIDAQGRYKVRFMFDEGGLEQGRASTWVRMLQPHGGSPEGFHFPLRKDTEVLCTFLGGDPDRPVIAGVVPNAVTPSPVTSSNAMTNVVQTGGLNRFELDDAEGAQQITLSTPTQGTFLSLGAPREGRHATLSTNGHGRIRTGMNLGIEVDQAMLTRVRLDNEEMFDRNYLTNVAADRSLTVMGDYSGEVKGDETWTVRGDQIYQVFGDATWGVNGNQTLAVTGDHQSTITGKSTESVGGHVKQTYKSGLEVHVTGDVQQTASGSHSVKASSIDVKNSGDTSWFTSGASFSMFGGATANITMGAAFAMFAGRRLDVTAGQSSTIRVGMGLDVCLGAFTTWNAGPRVELQTMKMKQNELDVDEALTKLGNAVLHLAEYDVHLKDLAVDLTNAGVHIKT